MPPTREAILNSALECFESKGYKATTTAEICRKSGASNGSLFHHFGSKEGVAAALYITALRSYHQYLLADLDKHPTADEGISHLVSSHIDWVTTHWAQAHFMFTQSQAEWLASIRDEKQIENMAFGSSLEKWRQPLIDAQELPKILPLVFFSQVIGPAHVLCREWIFSGSQEDLQSNASFLCDCAVRSFRGASLHD